MRKPRFLRMPQGSGAGGVLWASLLAGALLTSACTSAGSQATGSSAAVKEGGILRIGTSYPIDSMNPFVGQSDYSYMVFEYIYPELVQYNAKLQIVQDFATSWKTSSDGLTWTFDTRPNAEWSDGQALSAEDVAWNINATLRYVSGPTALAAGTLAHVKGAVATGPNTVVLHLAAPVANILPKMQGFPILPPQVWASYFKGNGAGIKTFLNTPQNGQPMVSGGPFEMVDYVKNQKALFKQNPNWYGPKPHITGFGLEFFSNDDAMVEALKTGQLDFIGEYTPPTAVAALQSAEFVVSTPPSISMKTFIINANPNKTTHPELLNPLVREAFEYATDRAQIVQTAWLGYATPGSTMVAPADGIWHDPNIAPLPFDLAKANQLLDQAGYKMGPNGVRISDGHPMSYNVIFPPDEKGAGDRTFQIMQADFRQIGVQIQQRTMDDTAAFNAISAPHNDYLTFDLAMWDWVPPVDPDFILSVLTCAQYGNWSDSGYCNPTYDGMYSKQSTLIDQGQRQQLIWKMQQTIYNARPYIILDYPDIIEAHSTKWTGFIPAPVMGSVNSLSKQTLLQVHQV